MAKILLVEDESRKAQILSAVLNRRAQNKHEIKVISELTQAEEALNKESFDLVVMDHDLRGRNTLEFIRQTRSKYPRTPVLAASGEQPNRVLQMEAGCCGEVHELTPAGIVEETLAKAKVGI